MLPSILTVLTNIFFGALITFEAYSKLIKGKTAAQGALASGAHHNFLDMGKMTNLNGPLDPAGIGGGLGTQIMNNVDTSAVLLLVGLSMLWWLTNRFLEGVTTALVYTHLTEGPGEGKVSEAVTAVFSSLPAIICLGIVTFIARRLAGWMRTRRGVGVLGFGLNFLAGVVEIFWTLAGHLILPAIVIEGTSFWGALKRADRIAQGNLLTIGIGEVGVDLICRLTTWLVYMGGLAGFGYSWYTHVGFAAPQFILGAALWAFAVVVVTALSIYIRAAFYTCLYVWAIDAEAVAEAERVRIAPPAPLAQALA